MDLPFLLKVDKYYILKSFPETYCIKCHRLEKNYICTECGLVIDKTDEIVIHNNDKYDNINNKYNNIFESTNTFTSISLCLKEIQYTKYLIDNFVLQLNEVKEQFKLYNIII